MSDGPHDVGLFDTSVIIDPETDVALPETAVVSAISLAELAMGPNLSADPLERARRQAHLQLIEATFDALPFDAAAARAYGQVCAAVSVVGRKVRGRRAIDLLIAATALSHVLPLYTKNAGDLLGLERLIEVVDCS